MLARILLLGALLTGAVAQPAASQGTRPSTWDQVGGWHIGVDPSMDDSCFARINYQDGTSLRIGFDVKHQTVHFVIANSGWEPLEVGKVYPVFVVFDDRKSHEVSLTAFAAGSRIVLGNGSISPAFIRDLMASGKLRIVYRGLSYAHLPVRDGRAAIERMADCQEAVQAAEEASAGSTPPRRREFSF